MNSETPFKSHQVKLRTEEEWRLTSLPRIQRFVVAVAAEAEVDRTPDRTPAVDIPAEDNLEEDNRPAEDILAVDKRPWDNLPVDNLESSTFTAKNRSNRITSAMRERGAHQFREKQQDLLIRNFQIHENAVKLRNRELRALVSDVTLRRRDADGRRWLVVVTHFPSLSL